MAASSIVSKCQNLRSEEKVQSEMPNSSHFRSVKPFSSPNTEQVSTEQRIP